MELSSVQQQNPQQPAAAINHELYVITRKKFLENLFQLVQLVSSGKVELSQPIPFVEKIIDLGQILVNNTVSPNSELIELLNNSKIQIQSIAITPYLRDFLASYLNTLIAINQGKMRREKLGELVTVIRARVPEFAKNEFSVIMKKLIAYYRKWYDESYIKN